MNKEFIPVNTPLLDGNEKKYLIECIDSGWISSEGPFVSRFEKQFATMVDRKYAVSVTSGTAALELAVRALGIGPGDEVIMPTFTIISCALAVLRAGGAPVLIDSDPITWNMDVSRIEEMVTERTRGIMVVHTYGLPVEMDTLLETARKHGLFLIEDAAQMHGQTCSGKPCGSFGDISAFSFYPNKHITTGEGGMVVMNDESLLERCQSLRNLCFKPEKRFEHDDIGWNFRMTNIQAALGVAQMERLNEFIARKRRMGRLYTESLSEIPGIRLPLASTPYADNIYWVYGIVLGDEIPFDAFEAMARLKKLNVGTRPFFWPMHRQPAFHRMGLFESDHHPRAENLAERGFYIPSGLALTEKQIDLVTAAVREALK